MACLRSRPSSASGAGIGSPRPGAPSRSHRCPPSRPFDALRTGDGAGQLEDAANSRRVRRRHGRSLACCPDRPLEYSPRVLGTGGTGIWSWCMAARSRLFPAPSIWQKVRISAGPTLAPALQVQVCPRWTSALCRQSAGVGARGRPLPAPGWPPRARPGVRPTVFRIPRGGLQCASRVDPTGRLRTAVQEGAGGCGAPWQVRTVAADHRHGTGALTYLVAIQKSVSLFPLPSYCRTRPGASKDDTT